MKAPLMIHLTSQIRSHLPRIIIACFLLTLFIAAPYVGVSVGRSLSDTLTRFGMNAILVLALVPMVQSGCGLNFGLPLGIIGGLLGSCISMNLGATGSLGFIIALFVGIFLASIFGLFYGILLNRVKGEEMMIATYVGFSSVALMSIGWLLLPFTNPQMVWGFKGKGLRTTVALEGYWDKILDNTLRMDINIPFLPHLKNFTIPTGMLLYVLFWAILVWAFFKTRIGIAITAVGQNPVYAKASGINVDLMRIFSVMFSTILGAIGIQVYQQSFGFIQLYNAPLFMAFPAVAAILLGGATYSKASLTNVLVGTFLFQGILTMTPSVINNIIETDISEVIRIVVSNGMILYALTRKSSRGAA